MASKRGELQLEDAAENRCGVLRRGRCESGGRRVEVRGKALPGPENARLMRKAGERERKRFSVEAKRIERKKNGMELRSPPPVRGKQQPGEGKQRALGKEKASAMSLE